MYTSLALLLGTAIYFDVFIGLEYSLCVLNDRTCLVESQQTTQSTNEEHIEDLRSRI